MRRFVVVATLAFAMLANARAADTVVVQKPTPYAEGATIAGKIKRECTITQQLPDFLAEYAREQGTIVKLEPKVAADMPGRVLMLEITDAMSEGNAFIGHHKYVTVKGTLYQDGKATGNFVGRRNSMGGAFAGFKGSCSVLGRTVKALGEDIAHWLAHPQADAQLGDLE